MVTSLALGNDSASLKSSDFGKDPEKLGITWQQFGRRIHVTRGYRRYFTIFICYCPLKQVALHKTG